MKVKIMYSAELDSLTAKFAELSKENVAELKDTTKLLEATAQILNVEGDSVVPFAASMVDSVRIRLGSIDNSLNEISTLLSGYNESILSPDTVSQDGEPEPTVRDSKDIRKAENEEQK